MPVFFLYSILKVSQEQYPHTTTQCSRVGNCFQSISWLTSLQVTCSTLMRTWTQASCLGSHRGADIHSIAIRCLSRRPNGVKTSNRALVVSSRTTWMRLWPISQTSCSRRLMHTRDRAGQWWPSVWAMTYQWHHMITRLATKMIFIIAGRILSHVCSANRPQTLDSTSLGWNGQLNRRTLCRAHNLNRSPWNSAKRSINMWQVLELWDMEARDPPINQSMTVFLFLASTAATHRI